jgi:16S rRNA (adenine(1408)-N(1))-methyltransferase
VTIDVGAGDGRAVLEAATADPATLAIGLDANAASMAELSRGAARAVAKGGRTNAMFVVASAEAPPAELACLAEIVTVRLPWGSLLRGCLGLDGAVAAGIAGLVRPGGTLELLLAPAERDGLAGIPTDSAQIVPAVANAFMPFGFELVEGRPATNEELRASGSTWAKRLLSNGGAARRAVTLVCLRSSGR